MSGRVLVVDDETSVCELLAAHLGKHGFEVAWRASGDQGFELAMNEEFDVVVTDLHMKGLSGLDLAERLVQNRPDVPVVVITAFGSLDTAIAAIRVGAYDFVTKPFELEQLRMTAARAIQHKLLRDEVRVLRAKAREPRRADHPDRVSASPTMKHLYELVDRVADSTASVLITGESGTGKELVARAIHEASPRSKGPFVVVNCAALPDALLESELFGHTRGAFTDARGERQGLFATAKGGTLLLDEIAELPLSLQPKLLRAVQSRRIRPVGSDAEVPIDVRILSATHRDLEGRVEEGTFREDLFYRICVIHVDVPPLRSRGGDVLKLAQHFLDELTADRRQLTGISAAAAEKLLAYEWPGNVRELQNCIERAVALARFDQITVEDLPEKLRAYRPSHVLVAGDDPEELVSMEEVERRYIARVLETVKGNKSLAARVLGFDRATLYRKIDRYGLAPRGAGS